MAERFFGTEALAAETAPAWKRSLRGPGGMVCSSLAFGAMNFLVKLASPLFPSSEITFSRFLFGAVSLGLLVSSRARTQMEAIQIAQMFLLPSIMLSGYIFPLASLPAPLRVLSRFLPATHYIAISRGIIIRGAGFVDLWPNVVALLAIAAVLVAASARAFRKTIS